MNKRTQALMNLIQDDDINIAALAMEELLGMGLELEQVIRENQEAKNPLLRLRMHQLLGVRKTQNKRDLFLSNIEKGNIPLLDGLIQISCMADPSISSRSLKEIFANLEAKLPPTSLSIGKIASFMKDEDFFVPEDISIDPDFLKLNTVLETRFGSSILCSAIAVILGLEHNLNISVAVYRGRYCVIDENGMLLDPSFQWKIRKIDLKNRAYPCSKKDIWLSVLTQLFLASIHEGNLYDVHNFGLLLTTFCNTSIDKLPYPIGNKTEQNKHKTCSI